MDNVEYNAYVSGVLSLVRTLVIKCEAIANVDNKLLVSAGYPVSSDKKTWRYYLNMNGTYHAADTKMMIQSLDTGETILFSKEMLNIHLSTRRSYASGGYWYTRLIETYPAQRELINGILNPIDLDAAISAADYKILRYNTDLVLWNEENLIPQLQQWIDGFAQQHFNNEYFYADNLMLPNALAALYGLMPAAIMTIRQEAVGTRYVHDFHIWSRLNSYGDMTKYKGILDNKQLLWLYRNIEWIVKNAGKNYTLGLLITNLLSERSIPIAHYDVTYNTENQLVDITPLPGFIKTNLNLTDEYGRRHEILSAEEIIEKEAHLAKDNQLLKSDYLADLIAKGKYSLFSDIPTKLLDSEMEDYTTRHAQTLMNTAYNHWVYLVKQGSYVAVVDVANAKNGTSIRLTVKEALILWTYLTRKIRGDDITKVEPVFYQDALKYTPPTLEELQKYGSSYYLYDNLLKDIISLHPGYSRIISTDAFYAKALQIYLVEWKHKKIYSQYNDLYRHAFVKAACDSMYERGLWDIKSDVGSFDEWLTSKELDLSNYEKDDLVTLAWEIFQLATGWDSSNVTLRTLQSSLIDLMLNLSSYTIHVHVNIDDGNNVVESGSRIDMGVPMDALSLENDSGSMLLPLYLPIVPDIAMNETREFLDDFIVEEGFEASSTGTGFLPMEISVEESSGVESQSSIALLNLSLTLYESLE